MLFHLSTVTLYFARVTHSMKLYFAIIKLNFASIISFTNKFNRVMGKNERS